MGDCLPWRAAEADAIAEEKKRKQLEKEQQLRLEVKQNQRLVTEKSWWPKNPKSRELKPKLEMFCHLTTRMCIPEFSRDSTTH